MRHLRIPWLFDPEVLDGSVYIIGAYAALENHRIVPVSMSAAGHQVVTPNDLGHSSTMLTLDVYSNVAPGNANGTSNRIRGSANECRDTALN
jgi:hypothetical protein